MKKQNLNKLKQGLKNKKGKENEALKVLIKEMQNVDRSAEDFIEGIKIYVNEGNNKVIMSTNKYHDLESLFKDKKHLETTMEQAMDNFEVISKMIFEEGGM